MDQIGIGAAIVIWQGGKVLLGHRLSQHGYGTWAFPGGHIEFGEHPEQAVIREAFEETGLIISSLEKITFTSDLYENGRHYITLFFEALEWSGGVHNKEPYKCEKWEWFDPDDLPEPLFTPIVTLLKDHEISKP